MSNYLKFRGQILTQSSKRLQKISSKVLIISLLLTFINCSEASPLTSLRSLENAPTNESASENMEKENE